MRGALRPSTLTAEAREHVSLLFLKNESTNHYCLITDLAKVLHSCSPVKSTFTELPVEFRAKHACVNIQCTGDSSFRWCLLADKYGGVPDHSERVLNYNEYECEFADNRKPMELTDINIFEKQKR